MRTSSAWGDAADFLECFPGVDQPRILMAKRSLILEWPDGLRFKFVGNGVVRYSWPSASGTESGVATLRNIAQILVREHVRTMDNGSASRGT